MSKKKSITHKIAIKAARNRGYDSANYVGTAKDKANVYICACLAPRYGGLPAFIKVSDGKAHHVDFKGAEFDECFHLLSELEE